MKLGNVLIVLGALLVASGLAPILYIEKGRLPNITSSYILMMFVPAVIALAPLLYQRARGLDSASIGVVLLAGVVIGTIPFWGPSLDPGMQMRNDWIGTIVAHYTAGAIVVLGGLLQLRELMRRRPLAA